MTGSACVTDFLPGGFEAGTGEEAKLAPAFFGWRQDWHLELSASIRLAGLCSLSVLVHMLNYFRVLAGFNAGQFTK